jgi:hypothetical protein
MAGRVKHAAGILASREAVGQQFDRHRYWVEPRVAVVISLPKLFVLCDDDLALHREVAGWGVSWRAASRRLRAGRRPPSARVGTGVAGPDQFAGACWLSQTSNRVAAR